MNQASTSHRYSGSPGLPATLAPALGAVAGIWLLTAPAAPAQASPVLELVGGTAGGGLSARTTSASAEAAYFNPALLGHASEGVSAVLFGLDARLSISVAPRPASADIAPSIYGAWERDDGGTIRPLSQPALATQDLAPRQGAGSGSAFHGYLAIGAVTRLAGERLILGVYGLLPAGEVQSTRVFYADEREQYFGNGLRFELYGDRLSMSALTLAVASRVSRHVLIGAGVLTTLDSTAATQVYVPDGNDFGRVFLDQELNVSTALVPHAGLLVTPVPRLRLSATVHLPSQVTIQGKNQVRLANSTQATQEFRFTQGYEPLTLAAGLAWDVLAGPDRGLALTASAAWRNFAAYVDRHTEIPEDAWRAVVVTSAGARYQHGPTHVFADIAYAPSPVPDQVGRSSYVDNRRLGLAAGMSSEVTVRDSRVRAGLFVQGHRLGYRAAYKRADAAHPVIDEFPDSSVDPSVAPDIPLPEAQGLQSNNPGFPGFASSGWLLAAGVSAQMAF